MKQRKKAGIPVLEADTLPSTLAPKMLSLDFIGLPINPTWTKHGMFSLI